MVFLTMTPKIVEALEKIQVEDGIDEKTHLLAGATNTLEGSSRNDEKSPEKSQSTANAEDDANGAIRRAAWKQEYVKNAELSSSNSIVGNPILHSQVIDLSRTAKALGFSSYSIEVLLKGSMVYIPPPPKKPEPVSVAFSMWRKMPTGLEQLIVKHVAN